MGELFQKKPKAATPLSQAPPTQTQGTTPDKNDTDINKALGRVLIKHGATELPYDVAGKSIAYVREALGPILSIPAEVEAWVDDKAVRDESTILQENSQLEFIKASGVKGVSPYIPTSYDK